jgi:hypothetical protein
MSASERLMHLVHVIAAFAATTVLIHVMVSAVVGRTVTALTMREYDDVNGIFESFEHIDTL